MDELSAIEATDSVEQLKRQRATRRGQITKIQKKVTASLHTELDELHMADLEHNQKEALRQIEIESAIQFRIEFLLADNPDDLTTEMEDGERFEEAKAKLRREIGQATLARHIYVQCHALFRRLDEMRNSTDVTSSYHLRCKAEFSSAIDKLYVSAADVSKDARIIPVMGRLKDAEQDLSKGIYDALKEKSGEAAMPTPSTYPPSYESALKIDLPKFDGKPLSWHSFQSMFNNVLDKRGKHLSSVERTTLLINAMTTKEARDIVHQYSAGGSDFDSAIRALSKHFGSIHVVYSTLVNSINEPDKFDMSARGLSRLHERIFKPYRHIRSITSDSLSQYLVQFSRKSFSSKLREEWDRHIKSSGDLPTLDDLQKFVDELQPLLTSDVVDNSSATPLPAVKQEVSSAKKDKKPNNLKCPNCGDRHTLGRCPAFSDLDIDRRNKFVKEKKLCNNCLAEGHSQKNCPSKYSCRLCHMKHHTILHREKSSEDSTTATTSACVVGTKVIHDTEFVDTALALASSGPRHATSRVLLDSGSGASFITECLASHLHLKRSAANNTFSGADGNFVCTQKVNVNLSPANNPATSISIDCFVVSKIPTSAIPGNQQQIANDPIIKDLPLADPDLGGPIDIILGNKSRRQCVTSQTIDHKELELGLTKTIFGWTVSGPLKTTEKPPAFLVQTRDEELDNAIQALWNADKVPEAPTMSPEDDQAVQHFRTTHQTAIDGRFIVKLPKKPDAPSLGASRQQAIKRFLANETSLRKKNKLEEFQAVLQEYIALGHAERISPSQLSSPTKYYLPIQGVFKDSSSTTKCRAVFDASARTSSGSSLNDTLLTGPNLYPLLTDILIKFRSHRIAISADISKMFREIWLHPEDRDLHRFFMRGDSGNLQEFRMTRLTFGVSCSPFLATQALRQIADNSQSSHPDAADQIRHNFYVDDLLSGADSEEEATTRREQLSQLLSNAGMTLRKWRSNSSDFLKRIPDELKETEDLELSPPHISKKALGIHWNSATDRLHVSTPTPDKPTVITKKTIASITAQVFDILGLFAPAIIPAKILMQSLWKRNLSWDEPVPDDIATTWEQWMSHLPKITEFAINRRYSHQDSDIIFRALHGFSDASKLAYGAAIYLRQVHANGSTVITLVTAKARVLPLKEMTIPRAELLAAHLLAKMVIHVSSLLSIEPSQTFAWTDSAIVLHWLNTPPHRLQTFVSNRVSDIIGRLPPSHWRHVRTKENPADLLSRGMPATELINTKLWWEGPPWLTLPPVKWPPILKIPLKNLPETKPTCLSIVSPTPEFVTRFSSFFKLSRIVAWIYRFVKNAKLAAAGHIASSKSLSTSSTSSFLAWEDVAGAKTKLINMAQQQQNPEVLSAVKTKVNLPKSHKLSKLQLRMDKQGTLKIICRVRNRSGTPKELTFLPIKHHITRLMITSLHIKHGHPGTSALIAIISEEFFIPGLRNFAKTISKSCATCQRAYAHTLSYQMGTLPASRTTPAPPFSLVGIDFAGPLQMKSDKLRIATRLKVYIAVFICMSTKAVHFDLCKGLSTDKFLATLKRFMNRRGTPSHIYSDNGTNFIGAKNDCQELTKLLKSKATQEAVSQLATNSQTQWHNIPPRAPHFGGLWENAVRRMKILLRKLMAPHVMTYDEIYSTLTEAEAIMNSSPLTPIHSDDISEDLVLTPGHFLIGRPIKAPISKPTSNAKISTLRRWRLTQRISQDLWSSWTKSYLQSLHHRAKWNTARPNVKVGDVVFIKDESLPYRAWPLAKITKLYQGKDNVVRTVDLLCHGKSLTRTVNRLIPCVPVKVSTPPPEDGRDRRDSTRPTPNTNSTLPPENVQV